MPSPVSPSDDSAAIECQKCNKTQEEHGTPLKLCAKCHNVRYCCRECQKADWKAHKKACSAAGADDSAASGTADGPLAIPKPFTAIDNQTYLHNRPEEDVYRLLIDAYRMHVEDDYTFSGDADEDSLYSGDGPEAAYRGFRKFVAKFNKQRAWLPQWWSDEKRDACLSFARSKMNSHDWYNLGNAIEKSDVIEHYKQQQMPMQLRMLAEEITGKPLNGPGGPGAAKSMRRMMMQTESGSDMSSMMLNIAGMR